MSLSLDFGLRVDGRLIRPAEPRTIAAMNQKKARVGGTRYRALAGCGFRQALREPERTSESAWAWAAISPGLRSTDRDRRVMETELDDRGLRDGIADKPVAGYLYFPGRRDQGDHDRTRISARQGRIEASAQLAEEEIATEPARSACAKPRRSRSIGRVAPIARSAADQVPSRSARP